MPNDSSVTKEFVPQYPQLTNPPIVEAMIDVQVSFPPPVALNMLENLHLKFQANYPKKRTEHLTQLSVESKGELLQTTADKGIRGYHFLSQDEKSIIQVRRDGFTFNKLAPYHSWKDILGTAKPAWDVFRIAFPQAAITRIGLRYLNQISLPLVGGKIKLENYFKASISGPTMEGLATSSFLVRYILNDNTTNLQANWTLAHQPSSKPTNLNVVLDIDVFQENKTGIIDPFPILEQMRDLKNRLFFNSFTQEGLDLFS